MRYFSIFANYKCVRFWGFVAENGSQAHREANVHRIHETQNHVADSGLVISIAGEHQYACNDMVSEHLPVVFPPLFNVDNDNLLEPEAELYKIVPLHASLQFSIGPACPESEKVQPMLMIVHDVLLAYQQLWETLCKEWSSVPCLMTRRMNHISQPMLVP